MLNVERSGGGGRQYEVPENITLGKSKQDDAVQVQFKNVFKGMLEVYHNKTKDRRLIKDDQIKYLDAYSISHDAKLLALAGCGILEENITGWSNNCIKGGVRLWDIEAGVPYGDAMIGHSNDIKVIAFSPDNRILATATPAIIILWDIETRQQISEEINMPLSIDSMAFSADGKYLLVSNKNQGRVGVLNLDVSSWVTRACQTANRNVTCQEWKQYMGELKYRKTCPDIPSIEKC